MKAILSRLSGNGLTIAIALKREVKRHIKKSSNFKIALFQ
jgi:hypothetical protein